MTQLKRSISPLVLVLVVSGVFFMIFMAASGVMFLSKSASGMHGKSSTSSLFAGDSVGVIELNGVIQDSRKTLAKLEKFEEDDQIKAVVLRMNSPGGSVAPSQEIYEAVKSYKKPLVVSMGSVAASGAYYIACGAKKVFANPGTMTGSIGVIMEFANLQKLYEWAKVQRYSIKTGKFKDSGAEYRDMTAEERALFQTMLDDILVQFKTAVATGRNLTMAQVTAIADGRIFSGHQAKEAHLVDELGTFKDAVNEAAKLAGIKGKPSVIYMEKHKRSIMDLFMDDSLTDGSESSNRSLGSLDSLSRLLELFGHLSGGASDQAPVFVPGAYWLWTAGGSH
jgi:protease-4